MTKTEKPKKLTTEEKLTIAKTKLQNSIEMRKSQNRTFNEQLDNLRDRIKSKDEKLREFKSKKVFTDLMNEIDGLNDEIYQLKQTIIKKQGLGCYECSGTKRLVPFSNISICLECINIFEKKRWNRS